MLALALNQLTYATFAYAGHERFSAEALPILASALAKLDPPRLNRVVYRYENELGLARGEDGSLGIEQYFPAIFPRVLANGPCKALDGAYEHIWQDEQYHGLRGFHARVEDANGLTTFRLAVFGSVENSLTADLARAASAAHKASVDLFESLISQSFREFISSELGE